MSPNKRDTGEVGRFYDDAWKGFAADEARFIARLRREALSHVVRETREAMRRPDAGPDRLLEIGPGDGEITARIGIAPTRLVALDLSSVALDAVRALARPCQGDAARLPFRDAAFRCLLVNSVLMFLPLESFVAEAARTIAPGGTLVVLEPLAGNPFMELYRRMKPKYKGLAHWHRYEALEAALKRGFEEVEITPYYVLMPMTLLPGPARFFLDIERFLPAAAKRRAWMIAARCRRPRTGFF